jgi:alkyl sulfatase BDS1-like metallo-beta-lactamase superfamily hydrolase
MKPLRRPCPETCGFFDRQPQWLSTALRTPVRSQNTELCCTVDRAAKAVRQATDAGALGWLDAGVLRSVAFAYDDAAQQELYAATIHQLLMLLLDAAAGR